MINKQRKMLLISTVIASCALVVTQASFSQTREQGPWWPSPHGPEDQAGASNYVTPMKILAALQIPQTGETYELGHIYEASMPAYGSRPYFMQVVPPPTPTSAEGAHCRVVVPARRVSTG